MTEENKEKNTFAMMNNAQMANNSFLQYRLDTRPLMRDIEIFLSAQKLVLKQNKDGQFYEDVDKFGEPMANKQGITALLNIMRLSMMNEHIVQGNLKREDYQNLLMNARKELTDHIIINCYEWGIDDTKLNVIIDSIMRFFKLFISRTIDNKERDSFMSQFFSKEMLTQSPKKESILKNFSGGFNKKEGS